MTCKETPTATLRFVVRDATVGDVSNAIRVLQQLWLIQHFSEGQLHKFARVWRDVPLLPEEPDGYR